MCIRSHCFSANEPAVDLHLTQFSHARAWETLYHPTLRTSPASTTCCCPATLTSFLPLNLPSVLSPLALTIPFVWNALPQISAWLNSLLSPHSNITFWKKPTQISLLTWLPCRLTCDWLLLCLLYVSPSGHYIPAYYVNC